MFVYSKMEVFASRVAFLFLVFAVVSGGYVSEVLSCQMQHTLTTSSYARHVMGILMTFVFMMMEGGWSFNASYDDGSDWSSGNVLSTMALSLAIYATFVLSSKMQLGPNTLFYLCLFGLYLVNTQRRFWKRNKTLTPARDKELSQLATYLTIATTIVLVYGVTDYVEYQKQQHGDSFSWTKFAIGKVKCDSVR